MASRGNHSFYREQEKSILGQQKWTAKRIGKILWTLMKWALWGFLIIATLWGCVNEFIIHTSKNMGQGVEFYQADDFVYPNTYQAGSVIGYTASAEAVEAGIEEGTTSTKAEAFNFNVINPNFQNAEAPDGAVTDQLFVKAESLGEDAPMYTYNLSYLFDNLGTVTFTGMLSTDWTTVDTSADGYTVSTWSVPEAISTFANEEIDAAITNEELQYDVNTMSSFSFYLADKATGTIDGIAAPGTGIWDGFLKFDEDATEFTAETFVGITGGLVPAASIATLEEATDLANWKPQYNLNISYDEEAEEAEKTEAINNQYKFAINKLAFTNGTGIASSADLDNVMVSEGVSLNDKFMEASSAIDTSYTVDMTMVKPTTASTVYGGAETMVIPIEKGFPVRIDEEGQKAIDGIEADGFREVGFQDWDTSTSQNQNAGFDVENQMYGWTVLDATSSSKSNQYQASLLRVYDDATSAAQNDIYADLDEDHAFYADQRRIGWGDDAADHSVFDEKVKEWMNGEYYLSMPDWVTVGGEQVQYRYGAEFAGMTSYDQIGDVSSDYLGVLPQVEATQFDADGNATAYTERSILSDSIIPTRQDAWGESRVTFIGWADWGKAWDVQYGPLYGAFVFPLAQLAMFLGTMFGYMASSWGVIFSIIVIVFLTRGLGALLSIKGTSNQMKMQEVQTDVAKIKAKYSKYDLKADPRMKQKQQMEIMALYRKKEINPMGSLGTIFITMPIFISLWIIISSLPAYKVVFMGNFSWAISSFYGIFNMGWLLFLYLLVGVSVGLVQGISSKLPTWLANKRKGVKRIDEATKEAAKKQNRTQNIMIGVFVFMGLTVPALFAFYWICSGFFTIILELIKHSWKVHVSNAKKKDPTYITPFEKFGNLFKKKA